MLHFGHDSSIDPPTLVFPAGLNISTMPGDVVVWRGLSWVRQVACRAQQGGLNQPGVQRLVHFHQAAGSARVRPFRQVQSFWGHRVTTFKGSLRPLVIQVHFEIRTRHQKVAVSCPTTKEF